MEGSWWEVFCHLFGDWEVFESFLESGSYEIGYRRLWRWKREAGGWNMGGQNLRTGGFGGAGMSFSALGGGHTGGGS